MDMTTSREGRRDREEGVIVPTAAAARSVEMLVEASWELTEEDEAPGCSAEGELMNPVGTAGPQEYLARADTSRGADEAKRQQKVSDERMRFQFALLQLISNNYWIISQYSIGRDKMVKPEKLGNDKKKM